ncbi:hypothetical protein L5515_006788 [Caenorhabditis briggsae]|nr:hypothetical protein L5515_006788 [Caenorhabditis briggsae]
MTMAITVFISETVYGALFMWSYYKLYDYKDGKDFEKFDSFTLTLLIVNSTIHSILCFFLSSQYRDTVLKLFSRRGNRVEPFNNRVDSSRHPISE